MTIKTIIIILLLVLIILLTAFLITKWFIKSAKASKLLDDILKEDVDKARRYSQGRVYLFASLISYFITLSVIFIKALKPGLNVDITVIDTVIEGIQWSILFFGTYVFGGKTLDVARLLLEARGYKKNGSTNGNDSIPPIPPQPPAEGQPSQSDIDNGMAN